MDYWLEELRDNRTIHAVFDYLLPLNFEEYNLLEDYLETVPEFSEWNELGFKLDVLRKIVIRHNANEYTGNSFRDLIDVFHKKEMLSKVLREKVKAWWKTQLTRLESEENEG